MPSRATATAGPSSRPSTSSSNATRTQPTPTRTPPRSRARPSSAWPASPIATVRAADGIVTEDARLAFQKILKLAPGQPQARFWLALAREQDGQVKEALAEYKAIVAAGPADAPWRPGVEQHIAEVSRRLGGAQKEQKETPRGPTAQDMAAAQQLSEDQRSQMIAGMVDGLARRLERDGKDLAGWVRLVNAYAVLGRDSDARAALASARKQLGGDDKAMAELTASGPAPGARFMMLSSGGLHP